MQGIQVQVHELSIADTYRIQDTLIARRLVTGDSLAGAKLGLTSKAKQEQMGVSEPAYGWERRWRCCQNTLTSESAS